MGDIGPETWPEEFQYNRNHDRFKDDSPFINLLRCVRYDDQKRSKLNCDSEWVDFCDCKVHSILNQLLKYQDNLYTYNLETQESLNLLEKLSTEMKNRENLKFWARDV